MRTRAGRAADVIGGRRGSTGSREDVFGVLLQQVGTTGEIHDYSALITELKSRKLWSASPPIFMALVLLMAPGKQGRRTLFFGSAQRFGVPMGYGEAHAAAFFAAKDEFKRSCRAVLSASPKDAAGNTAHCAWRCELAKRIRRESELNFAFVPRRYAARLTSPVCMPFMWTGWPETHCESYPPYDRYSGGRSATRGGQNAARASREPTLCGVREADRRRRWCVGAGISDGCV